jgi:hypothetical protein
VIGYVTLGTNHLAEARAYYDALFETIGARRLMELPHGFTLYGRGWGQPGWRSRRPTMASRRRPATAMLRSPCPPDGAEPCGAWLT